MCLHSLVKTNINKITRRLIIFKKFVYFSLSPKVSPSFLKMINLLVILFILVKPRRTFGRMREQIGEYPRRSREFSSSARDFSQTLPRFSTRYEGTDNMFYFLYEIIIFINKEKHDIRSAYCKFLQLGDSQTTLLTSFSCFIVLWKHTCRPIKTHVLSKLFYNYYLFTYLPSSRWI